MVGLRCVALLMLLQRRRVDNHKEGFLLLPVTEYTKSKDDSPTAKVRFAQRRYLRC